MKSLYLTINTGLISDVDYNGYYSVWLSIITIAVILSGVFVIISKNPILSVLYLISLFLCVSGYLMLLGLNFIGLSYLLVYVGAVSILFLFILMLINIRISEIIGFSSNSIPLGIFISTIFLATINPALPISNNTFEEITRHFSEKGFLAQAPNITFKNENILINKTKSALLSHDFNSKEISLREMYSYLPNSDLHLNNQVYYNVYSNAWDNLLSQSSYINSLGNVLYTSYPLWIILTSLVLLLAMVGCIIITIKN